jgi:hypothetical protein
LDSVTFSRLLGFGKEVRKLPRTSDFDQLDMTEYQYMYLDGHKADGKSTWLKPYYYVLNNILHQILYPKGGDSTVLRGDSMIVLDCFDDSITKFNVAYYIWNRVFQASEGVSTHFPYAPYIMHIIEQVSGIKFPTDALHLKLNISNKMSTQAKKELEKKAKGKSAAVGGSSSRPRRGATPPPAVSRSTSSQHLFSSSSGKSKKPNKFKFLMQYMFG